MKPGQPPIGRPTGMVPSPAAGLISRKMERVRRIAAALLVVRVASSTPQVRIRSADDDEEIA